MNRFWGLVWGLGGLVSSMAWAGPAGEALSAIEAEVLALTQWTVGHEAHFAAHERRLQDVEGRLNRLEVLVADVQRRLAALESTGRVDLRVDGDPSVGPYAVVATTALAPLDRIEFVVDGVVYHTERAAPYSLFGDDGTAPARRTLGRPGPHQIEARAYSASALLGTGTITVIEPVADGLVITPSENGAALVNAAPPGTVIRFTAGVHRLTGALVLKSNQVITGELGAGGQRLTVLSGSRIVTHWVQNGTRWVSTGATEEGQVHGECQSSHPRCRYPNDLFRNGQWLFHKADANVGPGQFHHDRAADTISVGENPAGALMEFSRVRHAIEGSGVDVTIRDLVIEQFAQPAQHGAIHPSAGATGWTVTNVEARLNHAHAIALPPRAVVTRAVFHDNGQMGFGCHRCDGAVVQDSVIHDNNRAGHDAGWEAGGFKIVAANDVTIRRNHVHHNGGPGIWFDIDNRAARIEDNHVHDHRSAAGIFYEISYGPAVIRRNRIERQTGGPGWCYGAAILVSASGGVEIAENTITESGRGISLISQNRGTGAYGPYQVKDVWVHHNTVDGQTQLAQACQDWGDQGLYTRNNRFDGNRYTHRGSATTTPFGWRDAARDWAGWRGQGLDSAGTYTRVP